MLSKQEYFEKFSICAFDRDLESLQKIRTALLAERKVLDKWFDKYLEMFERKMSSEDSNTPIWKLYKSKSNEYSELNGIINTADAYIKKLKSI